jgi:hypothetical protein
MTSVSLWYSLPDWLDDRKKTFMHDGVMLSFSQAASECFSKRKMLKSSENDSIHDCFAANNTNNIKVYPVNIEGTKTVGIKYEAVGGIDPALSFCLLPEGATSIPKGSSNNVVLYKNLKMIPQDKIASTNTTVSPPSKKK